MEVEDYKLTIPLNDSYINKMALRKAFEEANIKKKLMFFIYFNFGILY